MQYDLVILGAGPGGYVAAIRAAQLGARVSIIEKELVGGTCLNWGCIPTKAMYKSARLFEQIRQADHFGLSCTGAVAHLDKIISRNQKIVRELRQGVERLFRRHRVNLLFGEGRLRRHNEIEVTSSEHPPQQVCGRRIIIATGSEPKVLQILPWDNQRVFNTRSILELRQLPRSLFIIGGGVSGCEFAQIFRALGCEVHLSKRSREPIKSLDGDLNRALVRSLKKRRIILHLGDPPVAGRYTESGVEVTLQSGKAVCTEAVLVTVGRMPVSTGLGFRKVGLTLKNGFLPVDEHCQTNIPGIYAIGDVVGEHLLAHYASHQGIVAVEHALGNGKAVVDKHAVPAAIYTDPEIATVGLTSRQCQELGISYRQGNFPFRALGKAHALGEIDGFVKVIAAEEDGCILGVHIIGPEAGSLIGECTLALKQGATVEDVARTIHAHPTLNEAVWEAAEDVRGLAIHKLDLKL
ncbi:MAG: dihydrolipoyl dehydrogenase [Deltaproteobacteria bacterium]|nr:dihydrolipoyl dehydrogenase [Deltaproteobacteria bacterium]